MADPMETLLRTVMARRQASAPDVGDLLAGAQRMRRRRRRHAAVAAVTLLVAAAVAVPSALLALRNTAAPVPATTPTPQPTPSAPPLPADVGKVDGSWPTGGVGPITAAAGYAFAVSNATNDARPPVLRIGDDGVRSLQVAPASSPVGPSLITANTTAVYTLSQRPHFAVGPDLVWRIDPKTFTVTATAALPDRPFAAAASDRERSRNVTIDVLEQYVAALGGRLELTVVKAGKAIPLIGASRRKGAAKKTTQRAGRTKSA